MIRPSLILLLLLTTSAAAQDFAAFEKILFPGLSYGFVRGHQNTVFQTRLMASTTQPIEFYPAQQNGFSVGTQPKGIDFVRFHEVASGSAGRLLYFDRAGADEISFFYELAVTGPDGSSHRTTLPVIRERDFRRGPSHILGLTTGAIVDYWRDGLTIGYRARNHIRIYDVDNLGTLSAVVRITVGALHAWGSFATFNVRLDARQAGDPSYPHFAEITIPDLCITAPHGNRCRDYGFEVSIELDDPDARYAAIATATDNATGETAVFFAQ